MAGKRTLLLLFLLIVAIAIGGHRTPSSGGKATQQEATQQGPAGQANKPAPSVQQEAAQQPPSSNAPAEQREDKPIDDLKHGFEALRCEIVNSSLCGGDTQKYFKGCDANINFDCRKK